jgi:hypothetical protein
MHAKGSQCVIECIEVRYIVKKYIKMGQGAAPCGADGRRSPLRAAARASNSSRVVRLELRGRVPPFSTKSPSGATLPTSNPDRSTCDECAECCVRLISHVVSCEQGHACFIHMVPEKSVFNKVNVTQALINGSS